MRVDAIRGFADKRGRGLGVGAKKRGVSKHVAGGNRTRETGGKFDGRMKKIGISDDVCTPVGEDCCGIASTLLDVRVM